MTEKNLDILRGVQNQINRFDSKAEIIVSIVSIIFALSINVLEILDDNNRVILIVMFIVYLIIFLATISSLLMVIIPRTHNSEEKYANYYKDLIKMSYNEYEESRERFFKNEEIQFKQIIINATICKSKHFYLKLGILFSFLFTLILISLIILKIFL